MKDQSKSFVFNKKFRIEGAKLRVRLICAAVDRGTRVPAELTEPTERTTFSAVIRLNFSRFK